MTVCTLGALFFVLLFIVTYMSGFGLNQRTRLGSVSTNRSFPDPSAFDPCLVSAKGTSRFSPDNCVRRYFFFNLDNRPIDLGARVNSSYIPLTVAANLFYVRTASKWLAANEEYHYLYYHAAHSCPNKFDCQGPINSTSKQPAVVHPSWIAIKVILDLLENKMQAGDVGVSLDTDVFLRSDLNQTFYQSFHQLLPGLMNGSAPVGLIRDGARWKGVSRAVYSVDINSGIIMFVKTPACLQFFHALWASALIASPLELLRYQQFHFLRSWPWMQERLTWFASHSKWNQSVVSFPTGPDFDWKHKQPECFGIFCHMLHNKMEAITMMVQKTFVAALDCDDREFSQFCSKQDNVVILKDWLGRDVALPFRNRRFDPSNGSVWTLAQHIISTSLQTATLSMQSI